MRAAKALLKQSELTRYANALQKAGVEEWRIVARPDGSHEIIVSKANMPATATGWEDV